MIYTVVFSAIIAISQVNGLIFPRQPVPGKTKSKTLINHIKTEADGDLLQVSRVKELEKELGKLLHGITSCLGQNSFSDAKPVSKEAKKMSDIYAKILKLLLTNPTLLNSEILTSSKSGGKTSCLYNWIVEILQVWHQ